MPAQSTASTITRHVTDARARAAVGSRDRAARWRDLRGLPPYPIARPLAELWRLLGVKKLAPTAVVLIGVMRRARRQRFAGVQLAVEQWAHLAGCSVRTVQRNLRLLERLKLFKTIEQFEAVTVEQYQAITGSRARKERLQVASVYLFGEVGRFTCDTRPPAPESRRAFRSEGVTKSRPNAVRTRPKGLVPTSAPAAPTPAASKKESPAATSVPAACRRPQSNTPAAPAVTSRGHVTPLRSVAFGEGEGGPRPPAASRDASRWLSACPALARAVFSGDDRGDPVPESSAPGAARDVARDVTRDGVA